MDTLYKILTLIWKSGISESDFCESIGINKSAVTDWKKGKTKSYMKHIDKISEYFGVSKDYLLGNSPEVSKTQSDYDTYFEIQDILADVDEKAANTYTIHGSQGKGSVIRTVPKDKYVLIGDGETIELSKAEFTAVKGVIEAMRPNNKN